MSGGLLDSATCIVCGNRGQPKLLYAGLAKCPRCGLVFARVLPENSEIRTLYASSYFHGLEYVDYERDRLVLQRNFQERIKVLSRFCPGGKLLEIGSAYGFFLDLARRQWDVTGVDVSEHACEYAQALGLNVVAGDFLDLEFANAPFDVFCLWDTVEHLIKPHDYVAKMATMARDGSLLCLTTGDIGSIVARLQQSHWRLIHPPTHLYYFSETTLRQLLAKSGWQVIHVSRVGFFRSLDQVAYSLLMLGDRPRHIRNSLYTLLKSGGFLAGYCYWNLFDIMFVIAQYRPSV